MSTECSGEGGGLVICCLQGIFCRWQWVRLRKVARERSAATDSVTGDRVPALSTQHTPAEKQNERAAPGGSGDAMINR